MLEPPLLGFPSAADKERLTFGAFDRHRASPTPDYRRSRRLRLEAELQSRLIVYLDTRYWLFLRDAALGRPQQDKHSDILAILRQLTSSGQALCPIAEGSFLELLHQSDPATRLATAELMDELSRGVALAGAEDRIVLETYTTICRITDQQLPPIWSPWTRCGFVLGDVTPIPKALPPDERKLMQDAYDDHLWMFALTDILPVLGHGQFADRGAYGRLANEFNDTKRGARISASSFRGAYLTELRAALTGYEDLLGEAFSLFNQLAKGRSFDKPSKLKAGSILRDILYAGFKTRRLVSAVPTLDVLATLHAAMVWDRTRKYKPNDWLDFRHAIAALPYAHVFLTERSLAHLVQLKSLGLLHRYKTVVHHDPVQAFAYLAGLAA